MKKLWICVVALMLALNAVPVLAEVVDEPADWTVLFYLCGSDLESKYGYATDDLVEISKCRCHHFDSEFYGEIYSNWVRNANNERKDRVNVLIETGGSKQWHAGSMGMNISTNALQRWRYESHRSEDDPYGFYLEATLPNDNMAKPGTLTDFIRWGVERCPAKKYALVLWGHGNGSATGLLIDDLYNNDTMHLDELKQALGDSGTQFEAVVFDACMMANIETAAAIQDSAKWMIASEELVAGRGTAIDDWLQEMMHVPECDGEMLGHWICDMTQIKYANADNESARELLTWSVIDLSHIQEMIDCVESIFSDFRQAYLKSPELTVRFAQNAVKTERYGSGEENMMDLSGMLYHNTTGTLLQSDRRLNAYKVAMNAVPYCVRGSGRAAARGLSFCYAVDFLPEELDVYARNCPMPTYLSMLDAISPWKAPDWVYEHLERLPEMHTIDAYRVKVNKVVYSDGTPAFTLEPGHDLNIGAVRYKLYQKNKRTGRVICLGIPPAYLDLKAGKSGLYRAYEMWLWPTIDDQLCEIEALSIPANGNYNTLYNIPIQINSEQWYLRSAYISQSDSYNVYGLWNGYDSNSTLFNRNVKVLSQVAGQEYRLMYPIDGASKDKKTTYEFSKPMTMYRGLSVEDKPLPAGTYYIEYIIYDVFMRSMPMKRVEVYWDGHQLTIPRNDWSGQETLDIMDYYD